MIATSNMAFAFIPQFPIYGREARRLTESREQRAERKRELVPR
jgi:hypothetical protein